MEGFYISTTLSGSKKYFTGFMGNGIRKSWSTSRSDAYIFNTIEHAHELLRKIEHREFAPTNSGFYQIYEVEK